MNLASLPQIAFCEIDTAAVERAIIADYESITGVSLYPGDPVRLFLEALAYLIAQQRFQIDYAGQMNLVSLSQGAYLDHLGALLNTVRLGSGHATTSLRFTLSTILEWPTIIPVGTRATADGQLFWETTAEAVMEAGQTEAEAPAQCMEPGAQGNGLLPGQIKHLVDNITYVSKVANTSLTLGGTDTETDARYRDRVQLAPERLAVCGPQDAYRYWAKSVNQDIIDVAVWSPAPGQVKLAPLMSGGKLPSFEIIGKVAEAVLDKKVRPLTDVVQVVSPEAVGFQIELTYHVLHSYAHLAASIHQRALKEADNYAAWQRAKLGRSVRPSELISRVQAIDGVQRVEVATPVYRALQPWEVALADATQVTYGGLSDE